MASNKSSLGAWKIVGGIIAVLIIFVLCRSLPGPLNIAIPVMAALGMGAAMGTPQKPGKP
ncbi:hypothetical protein ACIPQA_15240 [Streptomyces sp. NPDC090109]|uniref:hypothetical protein n=1 Tax=Streptomyces sp. NPDC090109 TaxID=3365948 RepID=UPI00382F507E